MKKLFPALRDSIPRMMPWQGIDHRLHPDGMLRHESSPWRQGEGRDIKQITLRNNAPKIPGYTTICLCPGSCFSLPSRDQSFF